MKHRLVLVDTLRQAQDVLCENSSIPGDVSEQIAIQHLRTLVQGPDVKRALKCSHDDELVFALRTLQLILSQASLSDTEMIDRLRPVLEDGSLNAALGTYDEPPPTGQPARSLMSSNG